MTLTKLIPLFVLGAIGYHSSGAIKQRLAGAVNVRDGVVTKQNMIAILEAASLQIASGGEVNLDSPDELRMFIRKSVRIKSNDRTDLSKDFWGTPFKALQSERGLTLVSAGPDKKFGTKDDLRESRDIYNY